MTEPYESKDNEFVAWYPLDLRDDQSSITWQPRRAAYYVHIPFCTAICDYCGFAVQKARGSNIELYLEALRAEVDLYARSGRLANYDFVCGHFGGGTPSVIEASELIRIKTLIESSFRVANDAEVTVEINPISFTLEKALAYKEGGVNRLSFGVQSFDNQTLKTIGRPHRTADTERVLEILQETAWENFSIDMIYGVPGQSLDDVEADLQRVIESGATHVSCFRLEIIPLTALKMRETVGELPDRLAVGQLNEMDDLIHERLNAAGLIGYGAFNFARHGYQSVHNDIAFRAPQGEYVGFGNSSYSYINKHIYSNHVDIDTYQEAVFAGRDPIARSQKVSAFEEMSRYFVLGLKFFEVSHSRFVAEFGLDPESIFGGVLARLEARHLLVRDEDMYRLTSVGRRYVNNVIKEFFVGNSVGRRQHCEIVSNLTPVQINRYAEKFERRALQTSP